MFYCVSLGDGSSFLRVDLSLDCRTPLHATMLVFTFIMLGVHTIGTPAIYSYLFFFSKHHAAFQALKEQQLRDECQATLSESAKYVSNHDVKSKEDKPRIVPKDVLPGYLISLVGGYEYRTYWFELLETIRKVLMVGVPATFPGRGGTEQLFWGLLVCFLTFGACEVAEA